MGRVIVSLVSKQTPPNYLVIRELFCKGDALLFISTRLMQEKLETLKSMLADLEAECETLIFSDETVEEKWNQMCSEIESRLSRDKQYLVNLTGGTKYISLAVQKVFEKYDSEFFYLPSPKNYLLRPMQVDDNRNPLKYRVKVEEYLGLYGLKTTSRQPGLSQQEQFTKDLFKKFVKGFNRTGFEIIDRLRDHRDRREVLIDDLERGANASFRSVPGLKSFLTQIGFCPETQGLLTRQEIQYLTGGWFEEYCYQQILEKLRPDDIALNMIIQVGKSPNINENELDVAFTLGNKLFVIECKTGGTNHEKEANPIIYKATALKETLLGLQASSFIFSLGSENRRLANRARNMNATYCDRSYFVDQAKFAGLINQINKGL